MCNKCKNLLKKQSEIEIQDGATSDYFDKHIYFFKYEGIIRKQILGYKFKEKAYLYKTFAEFIIKNEKLQQFIEEYDIIMPVPISKKRRKQRGYNQSYLIAKEIGKKLNKTVVNDCLYKEKNIIEQSKLNKEQRIENIKGVYTLKHPEKIENKRVILIDDIFTTGSTVNECCKTLKNNSKVNKISVLTIAKD